MKIVVIGGSGLIGSKLVTSCASLVTQYCHDTALVTGENARIGKIKYEDWLRTQSVRH